MKALLILTVCLVTSTALHACETHLQVSRDPIGIIFRIAGHVVETRSLRQRYADYSKESGQPVIILADAAVNMEDISLIKRLLHSSGVKSVTVRTVNQSELNPK